MQLKYKQIMHTWMFGNMEIEHIFQCVHSAGFDGVDLSISDHESYNVENYLRIDIGRLAEKYHLEVLAASALMKGATHDLSQSDDMLRTKAIEYVKRCIDATVHAGTNKLLVMPSRIYNTLYHESREEDWNRSVASIKECGQYAAEQGVDLLLEPLNRQKVTLVHTLEDGVKFIQEVGLSNVFLVPDIYQMSMEEPCSIPLSLLQYKGWIKNIHIADSTRHVPGTGCYPWGEILRALINSEYDGPLSHEPVFVDFSAEMVENNLEFRNKFIAGLSQGIRFINAQLDTLWVK